LANLKDDFIDVVIVPIGEAAIHDALNGNHPMANGPTTVPQNLMFE
jgi:hypothetical protein